MARLIGGTLVLCAAELPAILVAAAAIFSAACAHGVETDFIPEDDAGATTSMGGAGGRPFTGSAGKPPTGGTAGQGAGGATGGSGGGPEAGGTAGAAGSTVDASIEASQLDATVEAAVEAEAGAPRDALADALCPTGGGTSLTFDGVASWLSIPGMALPTGNKPRTFELWMKVKTTAPDWSPSHTVFQYGGSGTGAGFGVDMDAYPMMELYVHPASTSLLFSAGITQEEWFHLAATYDGMQLKAFVNGVDKGTKKMTAALATTMTPLTAGGANARYFFSGSIDELRVWNVARTGAEIQATMSIRLTGHEPGLIGYWRFDEASGTAAKDATSSGNDATLSGTTLPKWGTSGAPLHCP
jgi:hypothetical protein